MRYPSSDGIGAPLRTTSPRTTTSTSPRRSPTIDVFVDTSVLYALLDANDRRHADVHRSFASLEEASLVSHSYVVVESAALVERRLGRNAACDLLGELVAQIEVVPVDESLHDTAVRAYLASTAQRPSLVDFTSFELMRRRGIRTAFAVDSDFTEAGFDVIPD